MNERIRDILNRLPAGWTPDHCGLAQDFVHLWKLQFKSSGEIKRIGENILHFDMDLTGIRLRGMDNVACLLISGSGSLLTSVIREYWERVNVPGQTVFILAFSAEANQQVQNVPRYARCLVLNSEQILAAMNSTEPHVWLKQQLRQQLSLNQLIPYDTTHPAVGNMFFGRKHELDRLYYEEDTSFAIAGPGKFGKTSLGREYHNLLVRRQDPRIKSKFFINFYECTGKDKTEEGLARFIAIKIRNSSKSDKVTADGLLRFLKQQYSLIGRPLDLLLDEVDEVCHLEAFDTLAKATRERICRIIVIGRGRLLNTILARKSLLAGRVELIRLQPLDPESARNLILEPLTDLGFKAVQQERFLKQVFQLTGRLPHLLQFYGKKLANLAITEGAEIISLKQVDAIRLDYETAQFFTEQLTGLTDGETRLVALSLLKDDSLYFTISTVQEIAARLGLHLNQPRALEICNDLVINNVLLWNKNAFCIANGLLRHYARTMKLLDKWSLNALQPLNLPS